MRVEVALEREQVKVEQLKLESIKEGKAHDSLMTRVSRSELTGVFTGFEVAESFRVLPKFEEKDAHIFLHCSSR